ncbi:MAG: hypothetical protein BWX52_01929 [Bacteroidetes bacterium ADurb.Bin013]|nr:MAG: hypothetical protein BWX52_01929 [Bacteroidetes bacterium ADurb.Bin013]
MPVDDDDFLDPVGHIEIPPIEDTHIARLEKIALMTLYTGAEILIVPDASPIAFADSIPLDVHLPYLVFFTRFSRCGVHRDHGYAPNRFPQADQFLSLTRFTRDEAVPSQGIFRYPQGLVILVRCRHQADILCHAVATGESLGPDPEQIRKGTYGDRIDKLRSVHEVGDVREVKCRGCLKGQNVREQGVCAVGPCGELHLVIGKDPEPERGLLQELEGLQKIGPPLQGRYGQEDPEKQSQVMEKRDPHGQAVPGGIVIQFLHLVYVGHQVFQGDHHPFGVTGRARGILQVNDIFGCGCMQWKPPCSGVYAVSINPF